MKIATRIYMFALLILLLTACQKSPVESEAGNQVLNEKILFYTREIWTGYSSIYTLDLNGDNLTLITRGDCSYPIWYDEKNMILYFDHRDLALVFKDLHDPYAQDSLIFTNFSIVFPRYLRIMNRLVFTFRDLDGISQLAEFDFKTSLFRKISLSSRDRANPVCSDVDDWIYFSEKNDSTYDIYRMKDDGTNYEQVLSDPKYNFITFAVSADGTLLVTPKYFLSANQSNYESYLVVFDIPSRSVLYEIPFSEGGIALYSSFTYDEQYILFVNGFPNNYMSPRNIYRMEINGQNLKKLTHFKDQLAIRPLTW